MIKIETIARVAQNINKAYCESIGDTSQPTWDDAPQWQKDSVISGVKYHLDNPDATPEQSHDNWLNDKIRDGWEWGEVKNPELKEHPCMLPYHQLPQQQRTKDYLFKQVIESLKPLLSD